MYIKTKFNIGDIVIITSGFEADWTEDVYRIKEIMTKSFKNDKGEKQEIIKYRITSLFRTCFPDNEGIELVFQEDELEIATEENIQEKINAKSDYIYTKLCDIVSTKGKKK